MKFTAIKSHIATILFLLLTSFYANGQNVLYTSATKYTSDDGLPQNYITGITQDNEGYLWVGTMNGLSRFDGKEWKDFKVLTSDTINSLIPQLFSLYFDRQKKKLITIHPERIVKIIDLSNYQISNENYFADSIPKENVAFRLKRSYQRFARQNLKRDFWFVQKNDTYYFPVSFDKTLIDFLRSKRINKTFEHFIWDDGEAWFMLKNLLYKYDAQGDSITLLTPQTEYKADLINRQKLGFLAKSDNRILFGGRGFYYVWNTVSQELTPIDFPFTKYSLNEIDKVLKAPDGSFIFYYDTYLWKIDLNNKVSRLWKYENGGEFKVSTLFIDRTSNLWVGTNMDGLYKINLSTPSFNPLPVRKNMIVDILTDDRGLPKSAIPSSFFDIPNAYGFQQLQSNEQNLISFENIYEEHGGTLYQIHDQKIEKITSLNQKKKNTNRAVGIQEINDSTYYYCSAYGKIFKISRVENQRYEFELLVENRLYTTGFALLNDSYWSAGNKSNLIYRRSVSGEVKTYELVEPGYIFTDLLIDYYDSTIWFGTLGAGLINFDPFSESIKLHLKEENGLTDNSIAGVLSDQNNNIWISTFNGINRWDRETGQITQYSKSNGIEETEFNRKHKFILPDGRLSFGATKSYIVFDPEDFEPRQQPAFLTLKEIEIGRETLTKEKLNQVIQNGRLDLDYDQNSMQVSFAALNYSDPKATEYQYNIKNVTKGWVDAEEQNSFRLYNLPFGEYPVKIRSTNPSSYWNNEEISFLIDISPPFWLTWYAKIFYACIILVIGFVVYDFNKKKAIRKQKELEDRREAEKLKEINEVKSRFYSNITHEFRTPLTLIMSPSEKILNSNEDIIDLSKTRKVLESNYTNAANLLNLVNQLLDISKIDGGGLNIQKSIGEISLFIQELFFAFKPLADKKDIKLELNENNIPSYYSFEKEHWRKIINNILSNAVKFTPNGGNIKVRYALEESIDTEHDTVKIIIEDSGVGIKREYLNKVFDRFYQIDDSSSRSSEGTGIGLALVKELIDSIDGDLAIESAEGVGTTVSLQMKVFPIGIHKRRTSFGKRERGEDIANTVVENQPVILFAEDNEELRKFIIEEIQVKGVILEAADGKEALNVIEKKMPDLVISDIMMPGMDGYELCTKIKENYLTSHIGVFLLSAKGSQISIIKGLKYGADEYISKPFHLNELELRIQNFVIQKDRQRKVLRQQLFGNVEEQELLDINDQFLKNLQSFILQNYQDSELRTENIASNLNMSKSTLNRKMKSVLGLSPQEYLKEFRLKEATKIIDKGYTVSEVSYKVGFENPSYFSKCFKEKHGVLPSSYSKD